MVGAGFELGRNRPIELIRDNVRKKVGCVRQGSAICEISHLPFGRRCPSGRLRSVSASGNDVFEGGSGGTHGPLPLRVRSLASCLHRSTTRIRPFRTMTAFEPGAADFSVPSVPRPLIISTALASEAAALTDAAARGGPAALGRQLGAILPRREGQLHATHARPHPARSADSRRASRLRWRDGGDRPAPPDGR